MSVAPVVFSELNVPIGNKIAHTGMTGEKFPRITSEYNILYNNKYIKYILKIKKNIESMSPDLKTRNSLDFILTLKFSNP